MKNLILGFKRGSNKWKGFSEALESVGQKVDVVIEDFDSIDGPYDRIWSMAESLLPLQAKLEKKYGIENVSEKAADILSDKKKMDDFCVSIGLKNMIPFSVIPTKLEDLNSFEKSPFIIKPVIGSGTKQNYDTSIDYISYKDKKDFMKSVPCNLLFHLNKLGFPDEKFNNRINFYMAQEHLPHQKFYAPYIHVNEHSEIKFLFWVEANVVNNIIDDFRFESRPTDFMVVDKIPPDVKDLANFFFKSIVDELKLKNFFFAGPDFYYSPHLPIKIIDCNPRIGQGLQILNEVHNKEILPKIILNQPFELKIKFWWAQANIKPGIVKEIKDMSHLKEYFLSTNPEIEPGTIIPKFSSGSTPAMSNVRIGLKIPGKNKSDMLETYRTVNQQIQECIVYV